MDPTDFTSDIVHAYTRVQAIADGVLIEVTAPAREAGFRYPVAMTAAAWAAAVAVPPGGGAQDEGGRLRDVLAALRRAVLAAPGGTEVRFAVRGGQGNREGASPLVQLKALCGPGDQGEPVLTVMLPGED